MLIMYFNKNYYHNYILLYIFNYIIYLNKKTYHNLIFVIFSLK